MALLNFNFNKILVEKLGKSSKQINIKSGMNVIDVTPSKVVESSKQQAFVIAFKFETLYEPNVAKIVLEGDLLYLADEELAKDMNEAWEKRKSLPKEVALVVFNKILHNCNVEALILSREVGLPAPVQLPKIKAETTVKADSKPVKKQATKNVPK